MEKCVLLGGSARGVRARQGVVFHGDDHHIVDAAGFYGDDTPGDGEFFVGLDGVVQGVAENRADVQWVQKGAVLKVDDSCEVNLFFAGGLGLVPDDDIQIGIAGAVVVFVRGELLLQMLDGGADARALEASMGNIRCRLARIGQAAASRCIVRVARAAACRYIFCAGYGGTRARHRIFQHEKVILHIVVDAADAGLIFHFLLVVGLAHLQLLGVPGGLHGAAHVGGQVDTAEA